MIEEVIYDVVVVGGGLAGMAAAVEAANAGASVLVVERAPFIGGSAAISMGFVWGMESSAALDAEDGGPFQRHGALVVEGLESALTWLRPRTTALSEPRRGNVGPGQHFDMPLLFSNLATELIEHRGTIWTDANVQQIHRIADGFELFVARQLETRAVHARAVVLASGGRQADPAVRRSLVGGTYEPALRGNPFSDGAGARLAQSVGGSLNLGNEGFYGHLFPARVKPTSPADFIMLAQYHSGRGVLVGRNGKIISPAGHHDHLKALGLAASGDRGVLLWSGPVQEDAASAEAVPGAPAVDRWEIAKKRGARLYRAEALSMIPPVLSGWGYDITPRLEEIAEVVGRGITYAMEVEAAITFTFGGITVNADGVVLGEDGSPIPRLYAVGADMSDAYHRGYGGGLCLAIVTGRRAGQNAMRPLDTQTPR